MMEKNMSHCLHCRPFPTLCGVGPTSLRSPFTPISCQRAIHSFHTQHDILFYAIHPFLLWFPSTISSLNIHILIIILASWLTTLRITCPLHRANILFLIFPVTCATVKLLITIYIILVSYVHTCHTTHPSKEMRMLNSHFGSDSTE